MTLGGWEFVVDGAHASRWWWLRSKVQYGGILAEYVGLCPTKTLSVGPLRSYNRESKSSSIGTLLSLTTDAKRFQYVTTL